MKNLKRFNELNEDLSPEMVSKNLEELKGLWNRLNKAKSEYKYAEAFQLHDEITGLENKLPKGHDEVDHYFLDKEITAALHGGDKAEIEKAKERIKHLKQEAHIEESEGERLTADKIKEIMAESGRTRVNELMQYLESKHAGKYDKAEAKQVAQELIDDMPSGARG